MVEHEAADGTASTASVRRGSEIKEVVHVHLYDAIRPGQGGAVSYVDRIVRWQIEHGIRATVLGVGGTGKLEEAPENLRFVPVRKKKQGTGLWWVFWLKLFWIIRFLQIPRDAVIHVERSYFLLPFILLLPGNPLVCTVHGQPLEWMDANLGSRPWKWLLWKLRRQVDAFCLRRADLILAVSEHVRIGFEDAYPWIKGRVELLATPVDLDRFRPGHRRELRRDLGLDEDSKLVFYTGRFAKQKDLPLLIEAFAIVEKEQPDVRLLLSGSGPEHEAIEKAMRRTGARRIEFLGEQPAERVPKLMAAVDVLALSSLYEGSPAVVREALACGTPVVSPPVGDLPLTITDPLLGRITERNPEALAEGLMETLDQDRDAMSERCRAAAGQFDHNRFMATLHRGYADALAARRGKPR